MEGRIEDGGMEGLKELWSRSVRAQVSNSGPREANAATLLELLGCHYHAEPTSQSPTMHSWHFAASITTGLSLMKVISLHEK